jgi:methyl halide transferase
MTDNNNVKTRDPEFWDAFYKANHTPWAVGSPCPAFFYYLDRQPQLAPGRVLVVGCGLGLEPAEFVRRGFDVTAIDLSEYVVEKAKNLGPPQDHLRFLAANVCVPPPEFEARFDYVFEQTCYCAIAPVDRPAYVQSVCRMLKPNGHLFGVFYRFDHGNYPPYPITREELFSDFSEFFDFKILEEAAHSAADRKGREWLAHFTRKSL